MVKFNKELLLREDVSIRITSEKEFQALLDWCCYLLWELGTNTSLVEVIKEEI